MANLDTETIVTHTLTLNQTELDRLYVILAIVEGSANFDPASRAFANVLLWDKINGIGAEAS